MSTRPTTHTVFQLSDKMHEHLENNFTIAIGHHSKWQWELDGIARARGIILSRVNHKTREPTNWMTHVMNIVLKIDCA